MNYTINEETTNLTLEMANSGDVLDLSSVGEIVVDKHNKFCTNCRRDFKGIGIFASGGR